MTRFLTVAVTGLVIATPAAAQDGGQSTSADRNWLLSYSVMSQYINWKASQGFPAGGTSRGMSLQSSHGAQLTGRIGDDWKLQVTARGGAIWSQQKTSGVRTSYQGLLDSSLGGTVTYYGFDGIQPFASLNVNIPTGEGSASGAKSKLDPDISKIPNYGEGWNWGGTVGATIPLSRSWAAAISGGYTRRGPYENEGGQGMINPGHLDPGDVWTLSSNLTWKEGAWSGQASVAYAVETIATLEGQDYFKSGDKLTLAGNLGYRWSEALSAKMTASWTRIARNEVYTTPPPSLDPEPFNSNGDLLNLGLSASYALGAWTITPNASLLYRSRNDYDATDLGFVPAKVTGTLGVGTSYVLKGGASLNASLAHTWAAEDANAATATPPADTRAWMLGLGGTIKF